MRIKLLSIFTLLCLAVTSAWAVTPLSGDTWDDATKTLTVNSNPGDNAYESQTDIVHVVFAANVTSIGESAFKGCSVLTSVTFAEGLQLTTIGRYAFFSCSGLTSVTIPASVTSIGQSAFAGCSGLTSVTFASGSHLTTIGESAFYDCSNINLKSIEIPASVTSIGDYAFYSCRYLTSVTIPASVTSIGQSAFEGCTGLTSVTFAEGSQHTTIGESAFNGCRGLTSVTIPASVTSIGTSAFNGCSGLTSVTFAEESQLTTIGESAFNGCRGVTSVTIPARVTSIGRSAFNTCEGLTSITFASGSQLTTIGESAFDSCSGLTSIEIPASVTSIGNFAFEYCRCLTSVTIPASVTTIGLSAFNTCSGLESVTFAEGSQLTTIGTCAFYGCSNTNLTSIEIPASVTSIGNSAFQYCRYLKSVTVYSTSCTLGTQAFDVCNNLANIYVFSDLVDTYKTNWNAYSGKITAMSGDCGTMAKWSLSSPGVLTISGSGAMADYVSNSQPWYSYKDAITSVVIGSSVTSIGNSAFESCSNLATVTLNSNPVIGTGAFPAGATVTMNLTANATGTDYWMTFYNENYDFTVDAHTTVYKGALNGSSLTLTEVADIPKDNAAILKSTASPIVLTLAASTTADFTGNNLLGGTTVTDGYDAYTLSRGADGNGDLGFYKFDGTLTDPVTTLDPNKAHLELLQSGPSPSRGFIGFDDETTGISDASHLMDNGQWIMDNEAGAWHDLSGRKLAGQPTKKGIYVRDGQKYIVK